MSKSFGLRRVLAGLVLLCGLVAGGDAWAVTNCRVTGAVNVTLSPCPYSKTFKFGTSSPVTFNVAMTGIPDTERYFVAIGGSQPIIQPNTFSLSGTFNNFQIHFETYDKIPSGKQSSVLNVFLCRDSACKNLLAEVGLPYTFDVVVPPAISGLSPSSATIGGSAFTLKVNGGGFTRDCKIHLGSSVLTTTYVSVKQLTASVNLGSVTKGQTYNVTVVPSTNIGSNVEHFTLKNPLPVITKLSPRSGTVGVAPFTLAVTGKGFISGSVIKLDGTTLSTKYISPTKLTATVDLSAVTAGSGYTVTVSSPAPGGGVSGQVSFALNNAAPVITGISPNQSSMSIFPKVVTVTGSGFQHNSQIQWNGVNQSTGYISSTQLTVQSPFAALTTANLDTLTVTTPSPGGGVSNTATLEVDAPAPTLAWVSPGRIYTGSGDVTVTVKGGFLNTSYLAWNGTPLTNLIPNSLYYLKGTFLQATIPAADLTMAGSSVLTAVTPGPGGGSIDVTLNIVQHPPQITGLSPGFALPGGTDFTLTLDGMDFDSGAQVFWNGDQLTITQISSSQIQVTVPAAEIASAGVASITVVNPAASGGVSAMATLAIDASGTAVVALAQPLNDIEWDPAKSIFYGAVSASASSDPHSIISIDPAAAVATDSVDTTDEPILLSLSGDDTFLYAGFTSLSGGNSSYRRYSLPSFSQDWSLSLPILSNGHPEYLKALQVSPTFSRLYAFVVGEVGFTTSNSGVSVTLDGYDTWPGFAGEPWDTLAWSPDGTYLYGGDSETSTASFMVDGYSDGFYPGGGTTGINPIVHNVWSGSRMHVDAASGLVYADNSAAVIVPTTGQATATLPVSGVMVPDSSLGCAYLITQTQAQIDAAAGDWTLSCYSTADYTSVTRSMVIPGVNGTPTKMLRWGNEGLAIQTTTSIYFISGQIVTGN
ncbi:MAG TPA: IPT/TIG domain-containing protein [Gammaproteobacteria bacterium]|jgi:hypothetical protein